MLDEQSRMAQPICKAVSTLFYEGRLRVADDVDKLWYRERTLETHPALGTESVSLFSVRHEARPGNHYRGYVCPESAQLVARITALLLKTLRAEDVLILTPFRAQRTEIGKQLKAAGLPGNMASTVHRAQGSERLVVILDPVRPSAGFLLGDEGDRLLNVAISRAKARLFLITHPDHYSNPVISQLAQLFKPIRADAVPELQSQTTGSLPAASCKMVNGQSVIAVQEHVNVSTLKEQFKESLYSKLSAARLSPKDRRLEIEQVAYSPRFALLTWAVRDRLIAEVTSALCIKDSKRSEIPVTSKRDRRRLH